MLNKEHLRVAFQNFVREVGDGHRKLKDLDQQISDEFLGDFLEEQICKKALNLETKVEDFVQQTKQAVEQMGKTLMEQVRGYFQRQQQTFNKEFGQMKTGRESLSLLISKLTIYQEVLQ